MTVVRLRIRYCFAPSAAHPLSGLWPCRTTSRGLHSEFDVGRAAFASFFACRTGASPADLERQPMGCPTISEMQRCPVACSFPSPPVVANSGNKVSVSRPKFSVAGMTLRFLFALSSASYGERNEDRYSWFRAVIPVSVRTTRALREANQSFVGFGMPPRVDAAPYRKG